MVSIKHQFQSPLPDDVDPDIVKPSDWNAEHKLEVTGPALLGRLDDGAGDVQELAPRNLKTLLQMVITDVTGLRPELDQMHHDINFYQYLAMHWAEYMPGAFPGNILYEMGITGDHYSAKYWATKAEGAFGKLQDLYLGMRDTPPTVNNHGEAIAPGSIYYDTVSMQPLVYYNGSWTPFYRPAKALAQTLIYRSGTEDTEFRLDNADINAQTYTLSDPPEPVEVFANGVRLTPRTGTLANTGDYEVDGYQNLIRFFRPIPAHTVVTIDIMVPPEKLQPGTVNFHHLFNIDIDPATMATGRIDGVERNFVLKALDGTTMNIGSPQELMVSVNGVLLEPGKEFTAAGSRMTFATAPSVGDNVWCVWMEPGGTGGGGKGVNPPLPPDDARLNVYEWIPGLGMRWEDGRGRMRSVRDERHLRSLMDPEIIKPGSLCITEDTLDIWIYQNDPAPGAGRHWEKFIPHHGNGDMRQRLIFDPAKPIGQRTEWRDDRATLESVATLAQLSDRTVLPASHIKKGKLLFVHETDSLYVLENQGADLTNTLADWKPVAGGVAYVGRAGNLPDPATSNLADGQMFVIRQDVDGGDIYRLVSYELASTSFKYLTNDTYIKPLRTTADKIDARSGDIQITVEPDHAELKVRGNTSWATVFSEDKIKEWISSLSLFEGTASEVGNTTAVGSTEVLRLPDLVAMTTAKDLSKVSHYWTWVGAAGYVVDPATPRIGADLAGATLNPGDWLQISNSGTAAVPSLHWTHIGGDLLVKSRGDKLYGLSPWASGAWEPGSLVVFDGGIFRATRAVLPADGDPTTANAPWTKLAIGDGIKVVLTDADRPATAPATQPYFVVASATNGGKPAWFQYDTGAGRWQQVGGGGSGLALKLTGGSIVYPSNLTYAGGTDPVPKVKGDLLINTTKKIIQKFSADGIHWVDLVGGGGAQKWNGTSPKPAPESDGNILIDTGTKSVVAYAEGGLWVNLAAGPVLQPPRFVPMPNRVNIQVASAGSWANVTVQTLNANNLIVGHAYRVDFFANVVTMSNAKWNFKIGVDGMTNREVQIADRTNMQTANLTLMFVATSTSHSVHAKFLSSPNGARFIVGGDFGELSTTTGPVCGGFSLVDLGVA